PRDATCGDRPVPDLGAAARATSLRGRVIGVPAEYFPDDLDPAVRRLCRDVTERMREAGAIVRPVSLPHTRWAIPTYYVLAPAEASSNLARYDGVRYGARSTRADSALGVYEATREDGFGPEVKRRIMLGTF